MVDRQDIDALLISALYGELTPADEARLTAHLESHPADRSALDSLTEIRATIRTSGFTSIHVDPPQAISAMLLQEAARRAPKMARPTDDREVSWFTRFVRSFAAHPAMAAAATLVMVAGIGGLLYMKQGSAQFAESTADQEVAMSSAGSAAMTPSTPTTPGGAPPVVVAPPVVPADKDNFKVDLDDGVKAVPEKAQLAEDQKAAKLEAKHEAVGGAGGKQKGKLAPSADDPFEEQQAPPKTSVDHGMIVNRDERAPKELATVESKVAPKPTAPKPPSKAPEIAATTGFGAGSANTITPAASPPPPPPQVAKVTTSNAPTAKPDDAKPQAPSPTQQTTSSLFAWAKDQHARVATLVRDGNCRDAAPIAAQIAARANDYYNQYVATDRALKACTAYFNDAREKDAERTNKARAQKRVDANEVSPAPTNLSH